MVSTPDPTARTYAESTGRVRCRVLLDRSGEMIEARGMLHRRWTDAQDVCTAQMHRTYAHHLHHTPAGGVELALGMANGLVHALVACPRVDQRPSDMRRSDSRRNLCPLGRALLVQRQAIHGGGGSGVPLNPDIWTPEAVEATSKGADLIKFRPMCPTA